MYIRDAGLLHALLGIKNREQLLGHPVKGTSWEILVIEQLASCLPLAWELGFWRTSGGSEIDLLLISGGQVKIAIEIKAGLTPRPGRGFYEGCKNLNPSEEWIIYPGKRIIPFNKRKTLALPVMEAVNRLSAL